MPYRRPTPQSPSGGISWSPRDLLIPYVLLAISLGRTHGYLIEGYLTTLGFFGIDTSTLYRTLRHLEQDGLLLSDWAPGQSGPARRTYALTDAGRAWLDAWVASLDAYRGMIDTFFSLYRGAPGSSSKEDHEHPDPPRGDAPS